MRLLTIHVFGATISLVAVTLVGAVPAQSPQPETRETPRQVQTSLLQEVRLGDQDLSFFFFSPERLVAPEPLSDLNKLGIKFDLDSLMSILRDSRHENWVLSAYPDPQTGRPLIGAGFSLDVNARRHIQRNLFNAHEFGELSSAQIWLAAGLDLDRLQLILDQYDRDLKRWKKETFRKKIRTHELQPELTEAEAMRLLRISTLQAIHNARAYCDDFDQLTASQQMALTQLTFQMGVNLETFVQFLSAINDDSGDADVMSVAGTSQSQDAHWKEVQQALIQSDWARRYTSRAIVVIAMFDPDYDKNPAEAERYVKAQIHPQARRHRLLTTTKSAQRTKRSVSFSKPERRACLSD